MPLPHFLIIGENKCGTSSLYHYLSGHQNILSSLGNGLAYKQDFDSKEVRFFDSHYDLGLDWYKSRFPDEKGKISGEASPTYFSKGQCAARIAKDCPNAKIILLLRNPIERTFSNYRHNMKWVPGFKERYPSFSHFLQTMRTDDNYILERSLYVKSWAAWELFYKPSAVLFLSTEQLDKDPSSLLNQVFTYLGLERHQVLTEIRLRVNDSANESLDAESYEMLKDLFEPFNRQFYERTGFLIG